MQEIHLRELARRGRKHQVYNIKEEHSYVRVLTLRGQV